MQSVLMPFVSPFLRSVFTSSPHGQWLGGDQLRLLEAAGTNACRIFSSPSCWVERFGADALVSYEDEALRDDVVRALELWARTHGCTLERIFGRFRPRRNEERATPILLRGDPDAPLETIVTENGMRFQIDFAAGYSPGLFVDQRANRAFLRRSGVRDVLNTFAYTCSFSVAAALAGATTTNIDLSGKSLARGRKNFALNGLDVSRHRFHAADVLELLPRLARKKERFDAIILDPPTFSRGDKGRRFQVERDFENLLLEALEVAAPGARVLLSTNCARLTSRTLETIARFCLKATRRTGTFHKEAPLPDVPGEFVAETLWLL